jgi:hypothetical protein
VSKNIKTLKENGNYNVPLHPQEPISENESTNENEN